jgi:RNA polymerase sigma factor (sigma-70 family)
MSSGNWRRRGQGTSQSANPLRVNTVSRSGSKRSILLRNRMVESELGLVEPIARHILGSLPPSFELDDLVSAGHLGLIEAAGRFTSSGSRSPAARFKIFARQRIRGAILDSIRRHQYRESTHLPIEEAASIPAEDVEAELAHKEALSAVQQALKSLTEAEALLLSLHYGQGMRLYQAGRQLEISPSNASRLRRQALGNIRLSLASNQGKGVPGEKPPGFAPGAPTPDPA